MSKSLTKLSAFLILTTMSSPAQKCHLRMSSLKTCLHTSLVCSPSILKTKWHRHVAKHAKQRDERSRELVRLFHLYLVVTRIGIKEAQELASRSGIHYLVDPWQRKRDLGHALFNTV
jgi:hypothetical protein